MSTVTASEANQNFSRLLREASAGQAVTITQRGRPVARLVPFQEDRSTHLGRQASAIQAARRKLEEMPILTAGLWTREDLHD